MFKKVLLIIMQGIFFKFTQILGQILKPVTLMCLLQA